MTSEFEIIERYFKKKMKQTALGVGDDAAMINVQKNYQLAISSDMLVENTHFLKNTNPSHLGWKSLAVNLSDIAAMGASPKWATLSISLPKINHAWLKKFSEGFFKCADKFGIDLIGGDTGLGVGLGGEGRDHAAFGELRARHAHGVGVTAGVAVRPSVHDRPALPAAAVGVQREDPAFVDDAARVAPPSVGVAVGLGHDFADFARRERHGRHEDPAAAVQAQLLRQQPVVRLRRRLEAELASGDEAGEHGEAPAAVDLQGQRAVADDFWQDQAGNVTPTYAAYSADAGSTATNVAPTYRSASGS